MLRRIVRAIVSSRPDEKVELESEKLRQLVRGIATTRLDEIACDECFDRLDCFVESTLAGKNASEAMPLIQDHLKRCQDCREEFEGLLTALHMFI